jgi:hypothetical protein
MKKHLIELDYGVAARKLDNSLRLCGAKLPIGIRFIIIVQTISTAIAAVLVTLVNAIRPGSVFPWALPSHSTATTDFLNAVVGYITIFSLVSISIGAATLLGVQRSERYKLLYINIIVSFICLFQPSFGSS